MSNFITVKAGTHEVVLNVDLITMIRPSNNPDRCSIYFNNDHSITVDVGLSQFLELASRRRQ
jgi:hypothetical protein